MPVDHPLCLFSCRPRRHGRSGWQGVRGKEGWQTGQLEEGPVGGTGGRGRRPSPTTFRTRRRVRALQNTRMAVLAGHSHWLQESHAYWAITQRGYCL